MRNEKEQVSPAKSNVFTYENDLTGREGTMFSIRP